MKSGLIAFVALGFLATANTSLMAQPRGPRRGEDQAAKHGWLSNLEAGKAEARKTGKPLMVVLRCVP